MDEVTYEAAATAAASSASRYAGGSLEGAKIQAQLSTTYALLALLAQRREGRQE